MFSFRRKPKKAPEAPLIRTSPSLPQLNSQGIPWPEDLVDVNAIRQESIPDVLPAKGAAKTSNGAPAISFHKPFGPLTGKREEGPISTFYTAGPPPSAFSSKTMPRHRGQFSQRRQRTPPTFNIMVRLLLQFTWVCLMLHRSLVARVLERHPCCAYYLKQQIRLLVLRLTSVPP